MKVYFLRNDDDEIVDGDGTTAYSSEALAVVAIEAKDVEFIRNRERERMTQEDRFKQRRLEHVALFEAGLRDKPFVEEFHFLDRPPPIYFIDSWDLKVDRDFYAEVVKESLTGPGGMFYKSEWQCGCGTLNHETFTICQQCHRRKI